MGFLYFLILFVGITLVVNEELKGDFNIGIKKAIFHEYIECSKCLVFYSLLKIIFLFSLVSLYY